MANLEMARTTLQVLLKNGIVSVETSIFRYACVRCKNILSNPRQLPCGHRYCEECVNEEEPTKCRLCPHENSVNTLFIDRGVMMDVQELMVQCTRKGSAQRKLPVKLSKRPLGCDQTEESHSKTGGFTWTVPDFSRKLGHAIIGDGKVIYSGSYFTEEGYQFGVCLYPNGDGMAKGSYLSVFFFLMKGSNDAALAWPFTKKISLTLVNQAGLGNIRDAFYPDPTSRSFQRPQKLRSMPSGCPLFCALEMLTDTEAGFTVGDTIKIDICVH